MACLEPASLQSGSSSAELGDVKMQRNAYISLSTKLEHGNHISIIPLQDTRLETALWKDSLGHNDHHIKKRDTYLQ